ncbi:hypothetical protein BJ742DRAFT_792109 [Cladochytrium replicatum]|nr:hypothetical protein BJ742DRAFT_792109 [Cladochytrium replicatum]
MTTLAAIVGPNKKLLAEEERRRAAAAAASAAAAANGEMTVNLEGLDPSLLEEKPLEEVQLDPLVVLKITKHCRDHYPELTTGQLIGVDVNGTLEVTNCFPFTAKLGDEEDGDDEAEYSLQMLRSLRKLNYDANTVGWYQSTNLGSYWNVQTLIETQFSYQTTISHSVVIVYDPTRTMQGNLCLRAMRLSDAFMEIYKTKKFTMESLAQHKMTPSSVLETLPIRVVSSPLASAFVHQLEESTSYPATLTRSLATPRSTFDASLHLPTNIAPLTPNFDNLALGSDAYLEKHLEYLGETIEDFGQEQWRWQGWQRSTQKEQAKLQQLQAKKAAGGPVSDEEINAAQLALNRVLATEPSRLESLIKTNQIDTYAKQINQFVGPSLTKMYMIKGFVGGK